MRQLRKRIILISLGIFSLFAILFGFYAISLVEETSFQQQKESVQNQLATLTSQLNLELDSGASISELNKNLEWASQAISERVTLINLAGVVLYDSHAEVATLENHFDRDEVQDALNTGEKGTDTRISESTNEQLYYVAEPLRDVENQIQGIIRLSKPIDEMSEVVSQIEQSLVLFVGISLVVTTLFTTRWTKKIAGPIEEIKDVAEDLANHDYSSRYMGRSFGEIDALGNTVNELATSLDSQLEEITRNDEQLRELINHLVIGVLLIDEERNIEMVNPAMNGVLTENAYDKIGKSYVEIIKSSGLARLIEEAYTSGENQHDEIYFYYPNEKIVDANVLPISDREKNTVQLIVLLYDITQIRQLEKVRTDFVANASHELKTPITALKGFTETLLDGALEDRETLIEFLNIIYKESTRLDLMVNDILQLSKLEHHQIPLNKQQVSIKDSVESVFEIVKQKAMEKQISLQVREIESFKLRVDPNQLNQILMNLITNAVTYTSENGTVTVVIDKTSTEAIIEISDTGMGIPLQEQPRIFERFYRVDKARSRNSGGTGLGLSIVKYLVENLRGEIEVKSQLGLGSTFTVRLPLD
ncbi:two-component system histidine kinase PnpS [Lacticigenium naphthae]|uniref:two-component system histidine kinase PnpS n=1 Tax=Lacticigenium naphthae TaxID=515351 RepID=UPI000402A151|nr:ATP-binding protein [Lacticigenium naphthae]